MTDEPLRLRCACGWETTGSEDELVEATQEHGRRMHNMLPTREQVLAMVVEPEGTRADAAADGPTA
jgi:predicted small metal-binding protein